MSRRSRWHLSTSAAKWTTCTRQSTRCREWEAQWHVAAPLSGKQRSAQRGDPGPGCSGQSTAGHRPSAECRPAGSTDSVKQRRKKDGSCATRRCGRACDHAENLTREIRSSFCTKSAMHQSQRGTSEVACAPRSRLMEGAHRATPPAGCNGTSLHVDFRRRKISTVALPGQQKIPQKRADVSPRGTAPQWRQRRRHPSTRPRTMLQTSSGTFCMGLWWRMLSKTTWVRPRRGSGSRAATTQSHSRAPQVPRSRSR